MATPKKNNSLQRRASAGQWVALTGVALLVAGCVLLPIGLAIEVIREA
jgi:hypothetical protein